MEPFVIIDKTEEDAQIQFTRLTACEQKLPDVIELCRVHKITHAVFSATGEPLFDKNLPTIACAIRFADENLKGDPLVLAAVGFGRSLEKLLDFQIYPTPLMWQGKGEDKTKEYGR